MIKVCLLKPIFKCRIFEEACWRVFRNTDSCKDWTGHALEGGSGVSCRAVVPAAAQRVRMWSRQFHQPQGAVTQVVNQSRELLSTTLKISTY